MGWTFLKQVDVILTRALLAAVLLTEWEPASPAFVGWVMALGACLGVVVLAQIAQAREP